MGAVIPQQVAVGLALQAMREALEAYGLLPGTRVAITTDAEERMARLPEELEAADPGGRQEAENGYGGPPESEARRDGLVRAGVEPGGGAESKPDSTSGAEAGDV